MAYESRFERVEKYTKTVGENINLIYKRLERLEADLASLREEIEQLKAFRKNTEADLKKLGENALPKSEFEAFVREINEVFEAIPFPPVAEPSAEKAPEEEEEPP